MALDLTTRPTYRSVPDYASTNGDVAAHIGEMVGLTPDVNQRDILDVIFAESRPGRLACFEVAAIAPRQNIKSSTLEIAFLTDLFVFRQALNIWTAHLYKTTRGAFRDLTMRIDGCDALSAKVKTITTANGNEAIELTTGERAEFHARSAGGGRGLTGDKVTLDEALLLAQSAMGALLPTMATRINGQVRYGSSAGLATSEVLRDVRDRGRRGADQTLGYLEWCAENRDCADLHCSHRFGEVEGCALDDETLWQQANPSLNDRLPLETLRKLRAAMPVAEFAREFLGWWEDPALELQGIPPEAWGACAQKPSGIAGKPVLAVSMTPDRSTVTLAAAGLRSDGLMHVEIIEHGRTGRAFIAQVIEKARNNGSELVIVPGHPVGSLIEDFTNAKLKLVTQTSGDYTRACGAFYDAVMQKQVRFLPPQPELDLAVKHATRKISGDVWRWAGDDISALVAVTQAAHAARGDRRTFWGAYA